MWYDVSVRTSSTVISQCHLVPESNYVFYFYSVNHLSLFIYLFWGN